jgi:hypothetical protein
MSKHGRCPLCHDKITTFMHTDDNIRTLGCELEWKEFSVCEDCYIILATFRDIVKRDQTEEQAA